MDDLLNAMMGNLDEDSGEEKKGDDPMAGLLGAMLGGAPQGSGEGQAGGDPMAGLLGTMMGGAPQDSGEGQAGGDPMAGLLGAMLGGTGQGPSGGQAGGDPLTGMLGGLLGAAAQQGSGQQGLGGMGGILGAMLGGGGADTGADSFLTPMVTDLAEKLGLPPEIAQTVVAFALNKLLSGRAATRSAGGQDGADMDQLLVQMRSGEGVDSAYLQSTGMAEELAQQTGVDADTAEKSLEEVFTMLGQQMGEGAAD